MVKIEFEEHSTEVVETPEEEFERLMKAAGITPGKPTKHFDLEVKNYQDHPKDGCTGQQLNIKGY